MTGSRFSVLHSSLLVALSLLLSFSPSRAQYQSDCWAQQQQQRQLPRDPLVTQHEQALRDMGPKIRQLAADLAAAKKQIDQLGGGVSAAGQELARFRSLPADVQNVNQLLQKLQLPDPKLQQLLQQHGLLSQAVKDLQAKLLDPSGQPALAADVALVKGQLDALPIKDLPALKAVLPGLLAKVLPGALAAASAAAPGALAAIPPLIVGGAATGGLGVPAILLFFLGRAVAAKLAAKRTPSPSPAAIAPAAGPGGSWGLTPPQGGSSTAPTATMIPVPGPERVTSQYVSVPAPDLWATALREAIDQEAKMFGGVAPERIMSMANQLLAGKTAGAKKGGTGS